MAQYVSVNQPQNNFPQSETERYADSIVTSPQQWTPPAPPPSTPSGAYTIRDNGGLPGQEVPPAKFARDNRT